jgi:hypothetical protein
MPRSLLRGSLLGTMLRLDRAENGWRMVIVRPEQTPLSWGKSILDTNIRADFPNCTALSSLGRPSPSHVFRETPYNREKTSISSKLSIPLAGQQSVLCFTTKHLCAGNFHPMGCQWKNGENLRGSAWPKSTVDYNSCGKANGSCYQLIRGVAVARTYTTSALTPCQCYELDKRAIGLSARFLPQVSPPTSPPWRRCSTALLLGNLL